MDWQCVELSEIPQALADVERRIEAAEELIVALYEVIGKQQRIREELRAEYRRVIAMAAKKYLERLVRYE
jgi:hypothetical protein